VREIEAFKRELKGLNVNDRRLYHRGILMYARQFDAVVEERARLLWNLAQIGYIVLYQKRDDEGVMGYWYGVAHKLNRTRIAEAERLA
jgi:hypothetical protein